MVQRVSGFQVEPGLFGVFDQESVAGEPAHDTPDEAIEQTLESLCIGRTNGMEPRAFARQRVDG
jgi:hypothetical protein